MENNLDIIAKKKNYIDYLANRPRVERIGTHGLFSNEGESVVLSHVAEEVANHPGVIWTNVISLRREDAERLGMTVPYSGRHYYGAGWNFCVKTIR